MSLIKTKFWLLLAAMVAIGIVAGISWLSFLTGVKIERDSWKKAIVSSSELAQKLRNHVGNGGQISNQDEKFFSGGPVCAIGRGGVSYYVGEYQAETIVLEFESDGFSRLKLPEGFGNQEGVSTSGPK